MPKKLFAGMCISLLVLSLFGLGLFGSMYMVLGRPEPLKAALRQSGLYQTGVGDALEQSQKDHPENNDEKVPLQNKEVRDVIQNAFQPGYLQSQTERVIDNVYSWLQGKTPKLSFTIDLNDAKTQLADGLANYAAKRLPTLPTCTDSTPPNTNVDPLNATCLPPGFNQSEAIAKIKSDLLQGDFLKDAKLDADSIKNDQGKTLSQQLQAVPNIYQSIRLGFFVLALLALVLAAGVVFLSTTWRIGLRHAGIILITLGAVSAFLGWLSSFVVHKASVEFIKSSAGSEPLQQKITRVVELLVGDIRSWLLRYGLTLVGLGVIALVGLYFIKSNQPADTVLAHAPEPIDGGEPAVPSVGRKGTKPKLPELKK